MIRDNNKQIGNILYNHLNLPTQIDFENSSKINYLYDATGRKVKKTVFNATIGPPAPERILSRGIGNVSKLVIPKLFKFKLLKIKK